MSKQHGIYQFDGAFKVGELADHEVGFAAAKFIIDTARKGGTGRSCHYFPRGLTFASSAQGAFIFGGK